MHFDPERQLLIKAPFYTNQFEFIINLAKSLPVGYKLYLKEHTLQGWNGWRPIEQYKEFVTEKLFGIPKTSLQLKNQIL